MALFSRPCCFVAGAAGIESLPEARYPEVAFIGRSNVGKSSLVNALTGRKSLAKTSQNPGHTKQLNFFLLDERLMLVDMPGYGYARISKQMKSEWDALIRGYFSGRPNLKRICLLIDARRGVMPVDSEFMTLLDEYAITFQLVLTKADAVGVQELSEKKNAAVGLAALHPAAHPLVIATSALDKNGIETLQEELGECCTPNGMSAL